MTIINPKIIEKSEEKNNIEEGCLSIPDIRIEIERPKEIIISYQDINLKEHKVRASDVLARVMLHEYDHLQGILFTDYLSDKQKKELKNDFDKIRNREIEVDYPVSGIAG